MHFTWMNVFLLSFSVLPVMLRIHMQTHWECRLILASRMNTPLFYHLYSKTLCILLFLGAQSLSIPKINQILLSWPITSVHSTSINLSFYPRLLPPTSSLSDACFIYNLTNLPTIDDCYCDFSKLFPARSFYINFNLIISLNLSIKYRLFIIYLIPSRNLFSVKKHLLLNLFLQIKS